MRCIIMFLAHTTQNTLLLTFQHAASLLLCTMSNAFATLNIHLDTAFNLASFACRAMSTATPGLFDALVTTWMATCLALGAVRDAKASLDFAVGTVGKGACVARLHRTRMLCSWYVIV